ncbi:MAG: DUF177 domain-containing protein [Burkholderiaceae bacterium]|nr:DUF177 domain-containing protein [Burkholderiaceae bacterium]
MASRTGPSQTTIDTAEFARRGANLMGVVALREFDRMRDLLAGEHGELRWELRGERRARHEGGHDDYLELSLEGTAQLACVRCLRPVTVELRERRLYRLFATESQALREDAEVDEHDALVGSARFDALALLEDEAILALPIAPRHPKCALAGDAGARDAASADPAAPRENPFAVLARIRGGGKEG